MSIELNHTIIWCSDKARSATFMTDILGLPPARTFFHFLIVDLANKVSVDFYQKEVPVAGQHYAFLVGEAEFDAAFARIEARGVAYWADPARTKPARSTAIMAAAASISPIPTAICSKSSPRLMARDRRIRAAGLPVEPLSAHPEEPLCLSKRRLEGRM